MGGRLVSQYFHGGEINISKSKLEIFISSVIRLKDSCWWLRGSFKLAIDKLVSAVLICCILPFNAARTK